MSGSVRDSRTQFLQGLCTGFVDLYDAAVGDLLQQSQQRCLVVSYSRVLVLSADISDADRLAGESAAHKTLSEMLAAAEVQHHVRAAELLHAEPPYTEAIASKVAVCSFESVKWRRNGAAKPRLQKLACGSTSAPL